MPQCIRQTFHTTIEGPPRGCTDHFSNIFPPVTLNLDLDLQTWPWQCQGEPAWWVSRSNVTKFKSYCPDTQTHQTKCSTWTTSGQ